MPTERLNGVDLYYEVEGEGSPLVLAHGAWTNGQGWTPVVGPASERYRVVTWDRRGHSRSHDGPGPGSRDEDAADLAELIEHIGSPAHVAGNSYGSIVVLTLVAARPDLVISAMVHEPPVIGLLEDHPDPGIREGLQMIAKGTEEVLALIEAGKNREAAEYFVERIAIGPGAWSGLPGPMRKTLENNAPTFLDEERDPTSRTVDVGALAGTEVPVLLTKGTQGPPFYAAAIAEVQSHVPSVRVGTIPDAGHIPYATHPEAWVETLYTFHDELESDL